MTFKNKEKVGITKSLKTWNIYPNKIPPDVPKNEDFGVEYEVRYRLPNGIIETMVTEWL